jgi:hypothetical protein
MDAAMETAIDTFFGICLDRGFVAYIVLFCIPLCAPGWRSLGVVAATLGPLSLWLYAEVERGTANVPLGVLLLFAVMIALAGLWSGLGTRAVLLVLRRWSLPLPAVFGIVVAGFLLWPVATAANVAIAEWQRRPPDTDCLGGIHAIEIQGTVLYLPAAPFLTVWDTLSSIHSFGHNRPLREFCDKARKSAKPLHAVLLTIEPDHAYRTQDALVRRYCASAASRWGKDFCSLKLPRKPEFVQSVKLYSTQEFNYRRMLAAQGFHERFREWHERALARGLEIRQRRIGMFEYYELPEEKFSRSYWVAADGVWRNAADEPFILSCFQSQPGKRALACETTYRLRPGLQVTYVFGTPEDDLEAAARRIEQAGTRDVAGAQLTLVIRASQA